MKRAIIVHCWEGTPQYCWYPQTKKELEDNGFVVVVPQFPETEAPKLSLWLSLLKDVIGKPDTETVLIGHSVGCITILRYLESLEEGEVLGGVVFVAGFTSDLGFDELKNFFHEPIAFDTIRSKALHFTAIHSDDDPYVPFIHGKIFKERLHATLITEHEKGHFSGPIDNETSCTSLPVVTTAVLAMVST